MQKPNLIMFIGIALVGSLAISEIAIAGAVVMKYPSHKKKPPDSSKNGPAVKSSTVVKTVKGDVKLVPLTTARYRVTLQVANKPLSIKEMTGNEIVTSLNEWEAEAKAHGESFKVVEVVSIP